MIKILFVCTANRLRSPLAAGFFARRLKRKKDSRDWSVDSAGTWAQPGLPMDSLARGLARKYNIDLMDHVSKPVSAELLAESSLVLVMEAGQKEALQIEFPMVKDRVFLLSEAVDGMAYDIQDPSGMTSERYQEFVDEMYAIISRGFDRICERALALQGIDPG